MSQRLILISAMKAKPYPLAISDYSDNGANTIEGDKNLTTPVQPNDIVTWVHAGDITSIDAITAEADSSDLFTSPPIRLENGTWSGVISPKAKEKDLEAYQLQYTVDGKQYTQDPKIQIHIP